MDTAWRNAYSLSCMNAACPRIIQLFIMQASIIGYIGIICPAVTALRHQICIGNLITWCVCVCVHILLCASLRCIPDIKPWEICFSSGTLRKLYFNFLSNRIEYGCDYSFTFVLKGNENIVFSVQRKFIHLCIHWGKYISVSPRIQKNNLCLCVNNNFMYDGLAAELLQTEISLWIAPMY